MTETQFNVLRSAGFALAIVVAVTLQRARPHARIRRAPRSNLGLWAVNCAVLGIVCAGCACSVARWAAAAGLGLLNASAAPLWVGVPLTVVGLDGVSYLWHRANHRVRWLWRFHQVHHSDADFSVSTAVRFHPGELLGSLPVRLAAVMLLGAPVLGILVFEVMFTLANFIEHGDIDLPFAVERRIARFCVTPALHRRHHSRRRSELDSNFGTIFTLWDGWFETYGDSSSAVRVDTGLAGVTSTPGLVRALALPLELYVPER